MDFFAFAVSNARRQFSGGTMECKVCGRTGPADYETGYDADEICPVCAEDPATDELRCPRCITGITPPGESLCVSCAYKDRQFTRATTGVQ